jgi:quinoprotein glucose dehydrogenase
MLGANAEDDRACRKKMSGLRYEGIYTPPSLSGTLYFPGNWGGVNWGSPAFDPSSGILYANTNRSAFSLHLIRRPWLKVLYPKHFVKIILAATDLFLLIAMLIMAFNKRGHVFSIPFAICALLFAVIPVYFGAVKLRARHDASFSRFEGVHFSNEIGLQTGSPYAVQREPLLAPSGNPCTPQPWGAISAINLNTGEKTWETPLGTTISGQKTGTINLGGPIVTAGGLVFTGASSDPYLRAFDAATGTELWRGKLPVPAQASPMTYSAGGKQYVVISAGGHGGIGTTLGDSVIAFSLE